MIKQFLQKVAGVVFGVFIFSIIFSGAPNSSAAGLTCPTSVFSVNLSEGATGSNVVALQKFLSTSGYLKIPAGATLGGFGPLTKAALVSYQKYKGISPLSGSFGPITRAAANKDCGLPLQVVMPPQYTSTSTITVISPNGGETWNKDDIKEIRWSTSNVPSGEEISIGARGYGMFSIIGEDGLPHSVTEKDFTLVNSSNTGSVSIRVNLLPGVYKLFAKANVNGTIINDISDNVFTVSSSTTTSSQPSITVSVTAKEAYSGGSVVFNWNPNYQMSSPYAYLNNPSGSSFSSRPINTYGAGDASFLLPSSLPAGQYKITICDTGAPEHVCGSSEYFFVIASTTQPTITSISPTSGTSGTIVTIKGSNLSGASNVEFYNSNGQPNGSLVPSSSSADTVKFIIDERFFGNITHGTYQVSVVTNACPAGCNSNKLSFRVGGPTPTNTPPKISGLPGIPVNILPGQPVELSWTATDVNNDDLVWNIDFGNGGVADSCDTPHLFTGKNSTHTINYSWPKAGSYTVKAVVSDCAGGTDSNTFAANVGAAVGNPSVTMISPTSGVDLKEGTQYTIKWSTKNLPSDARGYITVFHGSVPDGSSPNLVIAGPLSASTNSYTWTVKSDDGWSTGVGKASWPERIAKLFGIPSANAGSNQYFVEVRYANLQNGYLTHAASPAFTISASTSTTPQVSTCYPFSRVLTLGASGSDVAALQKFLVAKGFLKASGFSSGKFGTSTLSAVAAYQRSKGITSTGGFGQATIAAVKVDCKVASSDGADAPGSANIVNTAAAQSAWQQFLIWYYSK